MKYIVGHCTLLKSVNISSFNTSSVGDFMAMLEGCKELNLIRFINSFVFLSIFASMRN